jgi:hypothetical protein
MSCDNYSCSMATTGQLNWQCQGAAWASTFAWQQQSLLAFNEALQQLYSSAADMHLVCKGVLHGLHRRKVTLVYMQCQMLDMLAALPSTCRPD